MKFLNAATGDQGSGDDPHHFLGVVATMSDAERSGGDQLQALEPLVCLVGVEGI